MLGTKLQHVRREKMKKAVKFILVLVALGGSPSIAMGLEVTVGGVQIRDRVGPFPAACADPAPVAPECRDLDPAAGAIRFTTDTFAPPAESPHAPITLPGGSSVSAVDGKVTTAGGGALARIGGAAASVVNLTDFIAQGSPGTDRAALAISFKHTFAGPAFDPKLVAEDAINGTLTRGGDIKIRDDHISWQGFVNDVPIGGPHVAMTPAEGVLPPVAVMDNDAMAAPEPGEAPNVWTLRGDLSITLGLAGTRFRLPTSAEVGIGEEREIDFFPNSHAKVAIDTPFGSEAVTLRGPTTVAVNLGSLGDTEPDGLEQVSTELFQLELTGTSDLLGPITLRLRDPTKRPFQLSTGEIEETTNNTPGVLDLPPFAATGAAASFFDVFFELEAPNAPPGFQLLHNEAPARVEAIITEKPPAAVKPQGLDEPQEPNTYCHRGPIQLFDESGNPVPVQIVAVCHTPNPTVETGADLSITKVDSPDPVGVGGELTYRLRVRNLGPTDATGVIVTDTLPANVNFISASSGCSRSGSTITCRIGDLRDGETALRLIRVRPTAPGKVSNTATVTSNETDPNSRNNTATTGTTVR
jgi:uncharacterized repeat protein (TIGR01451 family)